MARRRNNNQRNNQGPLTVHEAKTVVGADLDKPFTFTANGKLHKLPPAKQAMANMEAGDMIDAALAGTEQAWIRYSLLLLTNSGVDPDTMASLRKLKSPQFTKILMRWMQSAGADVGK